jgi:hypothetical protein
MIQQMVYLLLHKGEQQDVHMMAGVPWLEKVSQLYCLSLL